MQEEITSEGRWTGSEFPIFFDAIMRQQKKISERMTRKQRLLNTLYCGTVSFWPIFIALFVLVVAIAVFRIQPTVDRKTFEDILQVALFSSLVSYFTSTYVTKKLVRTRLKVLFNTYLKIDFKVTLNAEGRVVETDAERISIPWGEKAPYIKEYPNHLLIADAHKTIILTSANDGLSLSEVAAQVKTWAKAKAAAPLS